MDGEKQQKATGKLSQRLWKKTLPKVTLCKPSISGIKAEMKGYPLEMKTELNNSDCLFTQNDLAEVTLLTLVKPETHLLMLMMMNIDQLSCFLSLNKEGLGAGNVVCGYTF